MKSTLMGLGLALAGLALADDVDAPPAGPSEVRDTDGIPYGVNAWPESRFGNHRAVVEVSQAARAVRVRLPWRSHSEITDADATRMLVFDAQNRLVSNVACGHLSREAGELAFEPVSGPGLYFVAFMFHGDAAKVRGQPDPAWLAASGLDGDAASFSVRAANLPEARLLRFESKSDFDRRDPMELIATGAEVRALLDQHPSAQYLVFPEDRRYPIRMLRDLPFRWIRRGPSDRFEGEASRGEYYTFQLGVFACRRALDDVKISFSDWIGPRGARVTAGALRCINAGGTDAKGQAFRGAISIERDAVQALWFIADIPETAPAGEYRGTVRLEPVCRGGGPAPEPTTVQLIIRVGSEIVAEHGCLDGWRMSRLAWLDSSKGIEDSVIPPYTPVRLDGDRVGILGRSITFNPAGFPESIRAGSREILAAPVTFTVQGDTGPLAFGPSRPEAPSVKTAQVARCWASESDAMRMNVACTVEFDGCVEYRVQLTALKDLHTSDTRLDIPLRREIAEYFMGMGRRGGTAPDKHEWKWDKSRINNQLWAGNASGGLKLDLFPDERHWCDNYLRTGVPASWDNGKKGGCTFVRDANEARVHAYTGARDWKAGDSVSFHFRLLVTPFKPIDMSQYNNRYAYKGDMRESESKKAAETGVNMGHVHQGAPGINPYINYPFLTLDELKAYHQKILGWGYKDLAIYYTVREISNHMPEIWALRSLGKEIYDPREAWVSDEKGGHYVSAGGGYSWLREHLVTGYAPAWVTGLPEGQVDAAIATQPESRLLNFYVEGMDLLMRYTGIGSQYIDGLSYDRDTTKRICRVMAKNNPNYTIKFHSGNNYDYAGRQASALLCYAEHLPYITDLMLGEGYSFSGPPGYFLTEVSGIPFGLTNEAFEHTGANLWLGMVYGMDGRMNASCTALWKFWDRFGIAESKMVGYWDEGCPVKTSNPDVLATAFVGDGKAMIAVGSWAKERCDFTLALDAAKLGFAPGDTLELEAPAIHSFQSAATFAPGQPIPVEPQKGWLFLVNKK